MADQQDPFFRPISGFVLPRFAGIPTFMRLPHVALDNPRLSDVQIGLIGAPWDGGTTNRPGARHGPRQLRDASTMIRAQNGATWVAPFDLARCADLGDVAPNPGDLMDTMARMEAFYTQVRAAGILPLTGGGDHLCSLPILRALARGRPSGQALALIQFDSHTDLNDIYFGTSRFNHGTPFRRAVEEGLIDPKRTIQIGIRGTTNDPDMWGFSRDSGMRILDMEEFHDRGWAFAVHEARRVAGDGPVYLTYDIDSLDPAQAPGTGTPEAGGIQAIEAIRLLRGLRGLDFVGADLVEVAPSFDPGTITAFNGASLLFEMLCLLTEARAKRA